MRRRMFCIAAAAVLGLASLAGNFHSPAAAEELTNAAAHVASSAGVGDPGLLPPGGMPPYGPAAGPACADGSCAGGLYGGGYGGAYGGPYGGGGGAFGLRPITCLPHDYLNPNLFGQFYVGGNCGSIPAGMYPSPMPTPPLVGHTYYTYQPLYPHEFMYAHKRVYHHHYNYKRGLHRTRVIWTW